MPQAPADVRRELNTFLPANSSNVLGVLGKLGAASSPMVGEGRCLQDLRLFSSLYLVWGDFLHDLETDGSQMAVSKMVCQTPGNLDFD